MENELEFKISALHHNVKKMLVLLEDLIVIFITILITYVTSSSLVES